MILHRNTMLSNSSDKTSEIAARARGWSYPCPRQYFLLMRVLPTLDYQRGICYRASQCRPWVDRSNTEGGDYQPVGEWRRRTVVGEFLINRDELRRGCSIRRLAVKEAKKTIPFHSLYHEGDRKGCGRTPGVAANLPHRRRTYNPHKEVSH